MTDRKELRPGSADKNSTLKYETDGCRVWGIADVRSTVLLFSRSARVNLTMPLAGSQRPGSDGDDRKNGSSDIDSIRHQLSSRVTVTTPHVVRFVCDQVS